MVKQVEVRFKELVSTICGEHKWQVIAMEVMPDHVHLFLNVVPTYSPSDINVSLYSRKIQ
ncbi:transposase IS200-family protein [Paenibacillus dendritiformis C454]|uniref:Transposase IS200-family protein n=1 Tax=Paenibacillus dendritiformis C454 TaxID=1131935 RepID=H3SBP5_9BACL|nr:transposase IS200-family protein [Paenibacillus dendritiformis C454]